MSFWRRLQFKIRNRWYDYEFKKRFLTILFILTIISFFAATRLVYALNSPNPFALADNMWILWLFIPIPLLSLILGIIYRKKGYMCTKNIVVGIIFVPLLFIYGSFTFIPSFIFEKNYNIIKEYEKIIEFDFPDSGKVYRQEWGDTEIDYITIKYINSFNFTNKEEIKELNKKIKKSDKWIKKSDINTDYNLISPNNKLNDNTDNMYYLIYITETKEFNTVPNKSGKYKAYSYAYNMDNSTLIIEEYMVSLLL